MGLFDKKKKSGITDVIRCSMEMATARNGTWRNS